jgi:enamine deaminase RidA (YjgF/YER057c/UK114 family)
MIEYLQPVAVPESDAPFSQVVVDDHYVHLAGLVAADFPEGLKVLGDVARETNEVLKVVEKILSELDWTMHTGNTFSGENTLPGPRRNHQTCLAAARWN